MSSKKIRWQLSTLFCLLIMTSFSQRSQRVSVQIGDPPPPLQIREWLKGQPLAGFEQGKVYVVEFWATWCIPCIKAMPHLSDLAKKYKGRVVIIGVDVMERKATTMKHIKDFVDSMGERMSYHVAASEGDLMETNWIKASGDQGIPASFIVDGKGRLAWIGHPLELDKVLPDVLNNTWNVVKAFEARNERHRLRDLDDSVRIEANKFLPDQFRRDHPGSPDSVLWMISEVVQKEPKLKYAPFVASLTFSALLQLNPRNAYKYAKEVILAPLVYEFNPYHLIIGRIEWHSKKGELPQYIYEIGGEVYQAMIDYYGESINVANGYRQMAEMYWRAKNKALALSAMEKAVYSLKLRKDVTATDVLAYESQLDQYKKM